MQNLTKSERKRRRTALEYTVTGRPTYKQDVKLAARDFFAISGELSVCNGLLVKGDRIVIPYTMRKEILEYLLACQVRVTVVNSGHCCCTNVTSFER